MSGKMSSHSCPEASNKAVQVSNDIFALPPLMLSHGGTRGGGGIGGDALCCMANAKFPELRCAGH